MSRAPQPLPPPAAAEDVVAHAREAAALVLFAAAVATPHAEAQALVADAARVWPHDRLDLRTVFAFDARALWVEAQDRLDRAASAQALRLDHFTQTGGLPPTTSED